MSLIKWNPVNRFDLFDDFNSMFNSFFNRPERIWTEKDASWSPRVDVVEKDKTYELSAELPGLDKKDINITVKDNVLTISGEKKYEEKQEKDNYYCVERRYGKFERSFRMADKVDNDQVSAEFKNGVLTLSIPKVDEPDPVSSKIEIK